MANQTQTIRIDSILGGESQYANFSGIGEYQAGQGLNPESSLNNRYTPTGYIIPSCVSSTAGFATFPLWMETTTKDANYYIYGINGSAYTYNGSVITALSDGGSLTNSLGNGLAYYDNYVYFAKNTTVARYGPLDGTPAFNGDYWAGTLSKTQLTDTTYKSPNNFVVTHLNHVMLRHTDGKLYFADVVGNQGVLHCISTTKSTVEGDTDNGSTFNAIDFPYGTWPIALASLGDSIAIALYEASNNSNSQKPARIVLWNPTNPTAYDTITGPEFPDTYITALLNSNGILYIFSGAGDGGTGLRITRYLGNKSFEQIAYLGHVALPLPGGVLGSLNSVNVCSSTRRNGVQRGSIFSIGSKVSGVSNKISNAISATTSMTFCSSFYTGGVGLSGQVFVFAAADDTGVTYSLYKQAAPTTIGTFTTNSYFISSTFRIGAKFKVTKIILNLTASINSADSFSVTPYILVDEAITSYPQTSISFSTYPNKSHIVILPTNAVGNNNFNLQLDFDGTLNNTGFGNGVSLPITIEYELIDE